MDLVNLTFEKREETGKGACGRLRRSGYIPAVFYGPDYQEAIVGKIKADDFLPHLRGGHWNTLRFDAHIDGGKNEMCIIRELSRNYTTDEVLHVDLYQLVKGHKVSVRIPIELEGKDVCAGVKAGGQITQGVIDVEISVLPKDIPEVVVLDVSEMEIGESVTLQDLLLPESAEILRDDLSEVVVEVSHGRVQEIEVSEEAEGVVEEEVETAE
ncbi:MAG: 50S ribosomal protein L25 [Dethiosulfovibrio peptidovorans]|nr:MAG: 50S ribosomal protein L25 [Dethiosulfovibrio peptidovorans]